MKKKILFFMMIAALAVVTSGCGAKKPAVVEPELSPSKPSINSFSVSQEPVPARVPTPVKTPEPTPAPAAGQASSSPASSAVVPPVPVSASAPVPPVAQKVQISIKNFSFNPAEVTVAVGSTVVWTNNDAISHDIKSASFNSPLLDTGKTFEQKFAAAGVYDYYCGIHPSMKGKIIVK